MIATILIAFCLVAVSATEEVINRPQGVCLIFGDPHLRTFPPRPLGYRPQLWCKEAGNYVIIENQYVKGVITVTDTPWITERFQFTFFNGSKLLCTINDNNKQSPGQNDVEVSGNPRYIIIMHKDLGFRIEINQIGDTQYENINIHMDFDLIGVSHGLCISAPRGCVYEAGRRHHELAIVNPSLRQRLTSELAVPICEEYLERSIQTASMLQLPASPDMVENMRIACENDVQTTGDPKAGAGIIGVLVSEGMSGLVVTNAQFLNMSMHNAIIVEEALNNATVHIDAIIAQAITAQPSIQESTAYELFPGASTSISTNPISTSTLIATPDVKSLQLCHVWGDPHILQFSQRPTTTRYQYWCKDVGKQQLLKNKYVSATITVHTQNWIIDEFKFTFFDDDGTILCSMDNSQQSCNSSRIGITRPTLEQMDIIYYTTGIRISVHQLYLAPWYDISIWMPAEFTAQSYGLCISPSPTCEWEAGIEQLQRRSLPRIPTSNRSKIVQKLADKLCEEYMMAGKSTIIQLGLTPNSVIENAAKLACIDDLKSSGIETFGSGIMHLMMSEAISGARPDTYAQLDVLITNGATALSPTIANVSQQIDNLITETLDTTAQPSTTINIVTEDSNPTTPPFSSASGDFLHIGYFYLFLIIHLLNIF
ncbi:unnamed protein product [Rotaria socialis]